MKKLYLILIVALSGCAASLPPVCRDHGGRDYPQIDAQYVLCNDGCIVSGNTLVIPGRKQ
jgi:hypothetical protein